ncbi:DEKNAAC100325 [Brettanomyces naardenensis]|uniref:DEKNAAC100325 n=1 Tax=Brettanomyces naardenensis TaxID=13370 RepID=A0A448YFP9_BRENA|nr:DEKNAAC100325 [Brettanomyces naardenensis]
MNSLKGISDDFRSQYYDISVQIQDADCKENLKPSLVEINNLKNWVSDRVKLSQIPQFDLKEYSQAIKDLVLQYDTKKGRFMERKFKFKHTPHSDLAESRGVLGRGGAGGGDAEVANSLSKQTYGNLSAEYVRIEEGSGNIYLKGLSNCTVYIPESRPVSSVTLEDCTDTIFKVHSDTFIFISNLVRCIVRGSCQQLRVHDSHHDILGISIQNELNRFIIENCGQLQVIDYHEGVTVDDFSCPNQEIEAGQRHSPNYQLVDVASWHFGKALAGYCRGLEGGIDYSPEVNLEMLKKANL